QPPVDGPRVQAGLQLPGSERRAGPLGPVRRHEEAGAGGDARRGESRRAVLRDQPLAGRHADQLPQREGIDRPPPRDREDVDRRHVRAHDQERGPRRHPRAGEAGEGAGRHQADDRAAGRGVHRRRRQGTHRGDRGAQAGDPDRRDRRHQLRSRPDRLPDPGQRRRHPFAEAVRGQDRGRLRAGPEGRARARQPAAGGAPGGRRRGAADHPRLVGRRGPPRRGGVAPSQRPARSRSGSHARRRSGQELVPPSREPPRTRTVMAEITAQMIKDLRERTGAGMADCKKALTECTADMEKAIEYLRKKGIASAAKKATRIASEGMIVNYQHGNRIGVLVEVNCETDFVARNPDFVTFAKEIAMQVAAMNPSYVTQEEIPPPVLEKEKAIRLEQAKQSGKPDAVIPKIVDGQIAKWAKEVCLLDQLWVKDPEGKKDIRSLLTDLVAKTGENVRVRRFVRYEVGEGLEKRADDFAAEVKKQAGQA